MKTLKQWVFIFAAFVLFWAAAGNAAAYDYPLKYLWEAKNVEGSYWVARCGDASFDFTEFINSKLGESTMENFRITQFYQDNLDPGLVNEWLQKGCAKIVYNNGDPDTNWAVLVPLSAYCGNAGRVYPVVFCLHGNANSILVAESYGYAEVGAREEFITVIPYSNNHETILEDVPRMMDTLKAAYPVDESRVYAAGFSAGGKAALDLALEYPALFAGIAPGGADISGYGTVSSKDERWPQLMETGMPVVNLFGIMDYLEYYPMPADAEKAAVFTRWLTADGTGAVLTAADIERALASEDALARELGAITPIRKDLHLDTVYYTGTYVNGRDEPILRFVAIEGMPHWPSGDLAQVAWDFLKHWSRDTETGELIYNAAD